jgi:predicted transcriptional regulator
MSSTDSVSLEPEQALDILGDDSCRDIILKTLSEPSIARELVDECEESRSTIYRKLEELVENGFLTRSNRIRTDTRNATQFEAAVDSIRVDFTEDGLAVEGLRGSVSPK